MRLRCRVCGAVQPVTVADEADEDPRTRSIRQSFRAEHAGCGASAVLFEFRADDLPPIDAAAWDTYLASLTRPSDATMGADGYLTRTVTKAGQALTVRVCEDCGRTIPPYVDFPFGLTSPESDGAGGAVPKWRPTTVETADPNRADALEHLRKAVCLPCYRAAFARVYPGAPLADLNDAVTEELIAAPPELEEVGTGLVRVPKDR